MARAPLAAEPAIWPDGAGVDDAGHLHLGGRDLVTLAERYGTPLYVYDAGTVRGAYHAYVDAFRRHRPVRVSYSVKACGLVGVASLLARAGADASAASIGEVLAARRAGFAARDVQLHGNAKTDDELREAVRVRVGRIAIDGEDEIGRLADIVGRRTQDVWLRVSPDVTADTHPHLRTAVLDSKFGVPLRDAAALAHVRSIVATRKLRLVGIHAHLGTQIHEAERYRELSAALVGLAREARGEGAPVSEIAVGGGLGIALTPDDHVLDIREYAEALAAPVRSDAALRRATLFVEPGRWLVGRAGVALYRVVSTKHVPGVRTFLSVDGGMGDNIRPSLYGATYTAVIASRAGAAPAEHVAVAGKYCESGDLLIRDVALPKAERGDVLAIPGAGAYAVAMASNYNHHVRPAVVLVDRGRARLIRQRERHEDIWRLERR